MSYQAYSGWFKQHTDALSTGKYWLGEDYPVELGEPVCWHSQTGFVANPINKRRIKSYDNATAGAEMALGVSLDLRYMKSGVSTENLVLRPDRYMPREITVMKIGSCPIKNMNTGVACGINETVLPANGGFEPITAFATGVRLSKHTLGKALEEIPMDGRGLIWVNPEAVDKYPLT